MPLNKRDLSFRSTTKTIQVFPRKVPVFHGRSFQSEHEAAELTGVGLRAFPFGLFGILWSKYNYPQRTGR